MKSKLQQFEEDIEKIDRENKSKDLRPQMTKEYLKKLLKSDFQMYYETPYLNDRLYLHQKGLTSNNLIPNRL